MDDLRDKSLLRCVESAKIVNVSQFPPLSKLLPVKVPCPGTDCSSTEICEWICPNCKEIVCFVSTDNSLICACGKYEVNDSVWNCGKSSHGPAFAPHNNRVGILRNLKPFDQYNILLIGQTGVGKTTFINAFVNYILFPNLDEALKDPGPLKFCIPDQFDYEDRNDFRSRGKITVRWGVQSKAEEGKNRGSPATRETSTYEMIIGGKIIRLIDTPGIPDTRGVTQDDLNMKNILHTLESVGELHAIMMLLKPDEQRLSTNFTYCLTESFSHLQKDAVKNILFGFTRSARTGFTLEGTGGLLEMLLQSRKIPKETMRNENLFFFDAEGFLHLAAAKQNGKQYLERNRVAESWKRSAEYTRSLINRTLALKPHDAQRTVRLDRVRTFVLGMIKPMNPISEQIFRARNAIDSLIKEIADCEKTGKAIPPLTRTVTVGTKRMLKERRTVCSDQKCWQTVESSGGGDPITNYRYPCHFDCNILCAEGKTSVKELMECDAISKGRCTRCDHSWEAHLQITYDVDVTYVERENTDAKRKWDQNTSTMQKARDSKEAAQRELDEWSTEDRLVKEALATFAIHLANEGMVTSNDATISYLEQEKFTKMRGGERFEPMEYDKQIEEYRNQQNGIEKAMRMKEGTKPSDSELTQMISSLRNMKHNGKIYRDLVDDQPMGTQPFAPIRVVLRPTGTTRYEWMTGKA